MNDITEVDRLNVKIADLKRTIEWYQGRTGKLMGEAARAGIAGDSVQGAGEVPRLIELLNAIKPNFGDVGSRDVEVRAQRERIGEAIAILSAAPASVLPLAPATVWFAVNRTSSMVFASEELARKYVSSFPASISGGMEVGSAPVIGVAQPAAPLPELTGPSIEFRVIEHLIAVASAAYDTLDNAEESGPVGDSIITIQSADNDALSAALDLLDALPDDKPGYTLSGPARASWALRELRGKICGAVAGSAASPSPAPAQPTPATQAELDEFLAQYEWRTDEFCHTPTSDERTMLHDYTVMLGAAPGASIGEPEDRSRDDEDWFFSPNDG